MTVSSLQAWLISQLAISLNIDPEEIDTQQPLASYGLDSATAVGLTGKMEEKLGLTLDPMLFWDYPTVEGLVEYLWEQCNLCSPAEVGMQKGD
ncbi:MAG: acyl carrier protein [Acidobacteriota bacterium]